MIVLFPSLISRVVGSLTPISFGRWPGTDETPCINDSVVGGVKVDFVSLPLVTVGLLWLSVVLPGPLRLISRSLLLIPSLRVVRIFYLCG